MKPESFRCASVRLALLCGTLALLALVNACASRTSAADGGSGEIITASDEPVLRQRARKRLELAVAYFEQGQTTVALDELKQSLAVDPDYAQAYSLRGLIYLRLNDFHIAEESFNRALTIAPNDASIKHNLAWLRCQQARYVQAFDLFSQALANPLYGERAKTLRALGLCQLAAGLAGEAEASLLKSYEFDAGNPVTGYNLALLLFNRGQLDRAQFYVRRINNSELANAESLWLGIKVERQLQNVPAATQLATQLLKRFAQSPQAASYQRGAFNE